jgi:tRNA pseudouridine55 synthase
MKTHVVLEKRVGQTPLQAIQEWKKENPEYADIPAAYAGRLDPMASGKLLILLGDECKRLKEHTALRKEYVVEVALGLRSDTGDLLGLIETAEHTPEIESVRLALSGVLESERGIHDHEYPAYSSKTVHGVPLFQYALEGRLSEIDIPTHTEEIFDIESLSIDSWPIDKLRQHVDSYLDLVPLTEEPSKALGRNFRIDDVRASWSKVFDSMTVTSVTVVRLKVACGSGTYMRSLAGRIGEALGTYGMALSIHRTRIGDI